MADWELIKTEYEVLGMSEEELCSKHDISPAILRSAAKQNKWSVPTTNKNGSEADDILQEAQEKYAKHQNALIPKYIQIETSFLSRLATLVGRFDEADEAKKLAETLQILKPDTMKQDQNNGAIVLVNKFPVAQPGDPDYVAPNAVLIGEAAAKGTERGSIDDVVNQIEIDMERYN